MEGLKDHLDQFAKYLLLQHRLMKNTIMNHVKIASFMLRTIGEFPLSKEQMDDYAIGLDDKNISHYHLANTLKTMGRYSEFIGVPVYYKKPKKTKPTIPDTLTEAEVVLILNACENIREKAIVAILADTGIRNEELCSIKVKDVDFSDSSLLVHGKGERDRSAYFSQASYKILKEYLEKYTRGPEEYLFTSLRHGSKMDGWAIRKRVKIITSRTPITKRVHPHLFRHSLATNMLDRGANIVSIQELLGHAHVITTMIYTHARKDRCKAEYQLFRPRYF